MTCQRGRRPRTRRGATRLRAATADMVESAKIVLAAARGSYRVRGSASEKVRRLSISSVLQSLACGLTQEGKAGARSRGTTGNPSPPPVTAATQKPALIRASIVLVSTRGCQ